MAVAQMKVGLGSGSGVPITIIVVAQMKVGLPGSRMPIIMVIAQMKVGLPVYQGQQCLS